MGRDDVMPVDVLWATEGSLSRMRAGSAGRVGVRTVRRGRAPGGFAALSVVFRIKSRLVFVFSRCL